MSRRKAIILAAFTLWPVVLTVLFICITVLRPVDMAESSNFRYVFCACLLTGIEGWALIAFYICHALRNDQIEQTASRLWAWLFVLGHVLAMSVYWYLYIWNPEPSSISADSIPDDAAPSNS